MRYIFMVSLILAASAPAAITLKTKVKLGDGSKANPSLTLQRGEWSAVGEDNILLKMVTATEPGKNVLVNVEIYSNAANPSQLVGRASLKMKCGEESKVVVTEPDGSLRYSFSARALRQGDCA